MKKLYKRVTSLALVLLAQSAFAQLPSVCIVAAADPTYIADVQTKLTATGQFSSVMAYGTDTATPSLAYLMTFDALLVFTDNSPLDNIGLGDTLANYIDAGGGVVSTVFDDASINIGGNYDLSTYRVLVPLSQTQGTVRTLGTVLLPSHSIMTGVTSFNGGSSSYMSTSTTLTSGSYRIADYDDGSPFITAKECVGPNKARRADLNMYPPSSTIRSDFWDASTNGALIMANALTWACGNVSLSLPNPMVCINWPSFVLTGGSPTGGTYSGTGVSSGSFSPSVAGVGTFVISYIYSSPSGCSDTATQTITVNSCQGVEETLSPEAVNIYPNPSAGQFNIDILAPGLKDLSIFVTDVQGKIVFSLKQPASGGSFNRSLSLGSLANGIYSLQVVSNLGVVTKKIVIQQ